MIVLACIDRFTSSSSRANISKNWRQTMLCFWAVCAFLWYLWDTYF
jgi:hypothetical protein